MPTLRHGQPCERVAVYLEPADAAAVDRHADANAISRSAAARQLIRRAIDQAEPGEADR